MPPSSDLDAAGVVDGPDPALDDLIREIGLVDHHTHGIVRGVVSPIAFAEMAIESDRPAAATAAGLDTQLGHAIQRWCGALLGLDPDAPARAYLGARSSITNEKAAERLLPLAGFERLIVETGYRGEELVPNDQLSALAAAPVSEVVRLETVAEAVIRDTGAVGFADAFRSSLRAAVEGAVGVKSIVAYRYGLDIEPGRPADADVAMAAGRWRREIEATAGVRVTDETLLRFLLWEGVELGLPLQVHTGFGDPDLDLRRADPLLLGPFIRAVEGRCPILLLHTYPFHRNAGYLAQMFPDVYMDVGLAVNYTGARAEGIVAESLELAPFGKILFSSDAWGIPELHLLGSWLFRRAISRVIGRWVVEGDWRRADAEAVVRAIASGTANRVYGVTAPAPGDA